MLYVGLPQLPDTSTVKGTSVLWHLWFAFWRMCLWAELLGRTVILYLTLWRIPCLSPAYLLLSVSQDNFSGNVYWLNLLFIGVNHGTPPGLVLCPSPSFFLYMPPQNPFWYSSSLSKCQPVWHFQNANLATLPLFQNSDCFRESQRYLNSLTVSGFLWLAFPSSMTPVTLWLACVLFIYSRSLSSLFSLPGRSFCLPFSPFLSFYCWFIASPLKQSMVSYYIWMWLSLER